MQKVHEGAKFVNFTATQTLGKQGGKLLGITVWTSSAGTLALADAKQTIAPTFSPAAGQFYPMPCNWSGELTITVGGTLNATAWYDL